MRAYPLRQSACRGKRQAVRTGLDKPVEFYDLEQDPGEVTELSESSPDVHRSFVELFEAHKGHD